MSRKIIYFRYGLQLMYDSTVLILLYLCVAFAIAKKTPEYILALVIIALHLLSYVIRAKAPNYSWIVFGHILMAVLGFLLPFPMVERVVLVIDCIIILRGALDYAYRKDRLKTIAGPPWPSFLFLLVVYFWGEYQHIARMSKACYICAITMLALYLIIVYVDGIQDYIRSTKDVTGVPIHNMIGTNNIVFGGIMLCLFLAFVLGYIFDLSFIFNSLKYGITSILKLIFTVFGMLLALLSSLIHVNRSTNITPEDIDDGHVDQMYEMSEFLKVLEGLLIVAVGCFVVYKLVSYIWKKLMTKRNFVNDIVEVADVRQTNKEEKLKKTFFQRILLSPEEKARKIYRQRIQRHKGAISLDCSRSGREISSELKEKEMDDVEALTFCYEDIRYGAAEVNREMLKKINTLSKG